MASKAGRCTGPKFTTTTTLNGYLEQLPPAVELTPEDG